MIQILTDLLFVLLCALVGATRIHRMNVFFKLVYVQVLVFAILYIYTTAQTYNIKLASGHPQNQWLYNFYILFECSILLIGAMTVTPRKVVIFITSLLVIFYVVFFIETAYTGIDRFANYSFILEAVIVSVFYIYIAANDYKKRSAGWKTSPVFLCCTGISVYFICYIPYMTILHYLQKYSPRDNSILYLTITSLLANVRYLFVFLSFRYLSGKTPSKVLQ
jgi:hypothetical protein